MSMYEGEYGYANTRLADTCGLLGGKPVIIRRVNNEGDCMITLLANGNKDYAHIKDLQFKSIRLGYFNWREGALFLARVPKRRDWRQGLRARNVCVISGEERSSIPDDVFFHLFKRYDKPYPSYKECLRSRIKMAWDKDWAASRGLIFYRGSRDHVAKHNPDGNEIVFSESHQHLRESLERSLKNESVSIR